MPYEMSPRLGSRLREVRKRAGMSQSGVAQRLGVTQQAVSRWEDGEFPKGNRLGEIAEAYGLPVEEVEELWQADLRAAGSVDQAELAALRLQVAELQEAVRRLNQQQSEPPQL